MSLPGNLFSLSNHLGINITLNSIGIVALDKSKKVSFQETITSPTPFFQGDTVDIEAIAAALKNILQKMGSHPKEAAVSFPERIAYSREHIFPKIELKEIDEAINWQLASIFPLESSDIYTDWKLLEQNESEVHIVVVAVSRKFLEGLQLACQQAGVQPMSFEPSASALARVQQEQHKDHIILEVDNFGTSASLIEKSVSTLTTTTTFSQNESLEQLIVNINNSLQHLINHHQRKVKETPEKESLVVYLTGEKASAKLIDLLAAAKLTVQMLPVPLEQPGLHLPYLAALSTVLPPESEKSINLLPTTLQHQYQLETNLGHAKSLLLSGTVIGAAACVISTAFFITTLVLSNQLTRQIAGTTQPPPPQSTLNIPLTLKKAQLISQLSPQKYVPTQALLALHEAGILNTSLKQLSYDASKKRLQVTVKSSDRNTLYEVKANLEKTGKFTSISVPLSAFSLETGEESTITLLIK